MRTMVDAAGVKHSRYSMMSPEEKERRKQHRKRYFEAHKDEYYKREHRRRAAIKARVFDHYGRKCACCGEAEPEFLSIDHMNGGGKKHMKEIGGGATQLYRWIVGNNYPPGFQVLCMNCNHAKGRHGGDGICPHERERRIQIA